MASITVHVPQGYPVGTTLGAYVDRVGDIQPQGTPAESAVVAADSTITFTTLTAGLPYQVGAVIGGVWRSFLIEPPSPVPELSLYALSSELIAHEAAAAAQFSAETAARTAADALKANIASPAFTGTIGIPIYTLATLPTAASVGAGKLVYVSDALSGTRLQWSDGATWQSAGAVLGNLSADTPDKLLWKTAGGTIIELYGLETAAGYQPQNVDPFTTAGYVNHWLVNGVAPTFASDELQIVNPGDTNSNLTRGDWGTFGDQTSMSVRFRWLFAGGYHNSWVRIGYTPLADAANSDSAHLIARLGQPFPEDGSYHLFVDAGGTAVDLGTIALATIDSDAAGWLRLTLARNGNQLTASLVRESDNAVLASGTVADVHTLSGGTPYAAGTSHYPYLSARGNNPGFYFDDFTQSVSSPEARDLMVAITPAGGARTTRRLFGSSGLTLQSDLITNALLTTKGDLIAATGAGAPARMAAAGVAGNVMTEDPTVASGWKSAAPPGGAAPGYAEVTLLHHANVETNWPAQPSASFNSNQALGFYRTSSGAQNAELEWDVVLDAGTYTFRLLHAAGNDHGVYHLMLDGVDVGTIDGYNSAVSLLNQMGEVTGIVVGSAGKHRVGLKMATKNASSSNYYGQATQLAMTRTGA